MRIQARTGLRHSSRHIPVSPDDSFGKECQQFSEQFGQPSGLFRRPGISRSAQFIKPALVTDTDGTTVVGATVSTYFQQFAMLRQYTVLAYVEVIPYGAESPCLMITQELSGRVIPVAPGGGTVEDEVTDTFSRLHERTTLHSGQEPVLIEHQVLTDSQWKSIRDHNRDWMKGEQLVTPNAVSAAIAA